MALGALKSFLEARVCPPDAGAEACTHTSLSGGRCESTSRGKYRIPPGDHGRFMDLYCDALANNNNNNNNPAATTKCLSLVERHRYTGPIVIDLDLRQSSATRQYDHHTHVVPFLARLMTEIERIWDLDPSSSPPPDVCVHEKPAPRPNKNKTTYKDGLHVIVPELFSSPSAQQALRTAMLPHVRDIFSDFISDAVSEKDIYDEAVIERNGWVMYGSKKPDEPAPWRLTAVWHIAATGDEGGGYELETIVPEQEQEMRADLARRFSIRRCDAPDDPPLTAHGQALVDAIDEANRRSRSRTMLPQPRATAVVAEPISEEEATTLTELVDMLSVERATGFESWRNVGFALHDATNGTEVGLELWKRFSSKCPGKFDEVETERTWSKLDVRERRQQGARGSGPRITKGSLFHWAKEDAGETAYKAWQRRRAGLSHHRARGATPIATTGAMIAAPPPQSPSASMGGGAHNEAAEVIADLLLRHFPATMDGLNAATLQLTRTDDGGISYEDPTSGISGEIDAPNEKDNYWGRVAWRNDPAVPGGRAYLGFLLADANIEIKGPMTYLHKSIPASADKFEVLLPDEEKMMLRSTTPNVPAIISVHNARDDAKAWLYVHGLQGGEDAVVKRGSRQMQKNIRDLRSDVCRAVDAMDRSLFTNNGVIGTLNLMVVNNNGGKSDGDDERSDFECLRDVLMGHCKTNRLTKQVDNDDGIIYAPVPGCPCAYHKMCTFKELINTVLKNNPKYLRHPIRFRELKEFLNNYEVDDLPVLKRDRDLLSFSNGVLRLSTATFTPYQEIDANNADTIARHHVPIPFDVHCPSPPLLDRIISAQLDVDATEILYAMLGRLLFRVGTMDRWQVMPYIVGVAGTGKSIILTAISKLFAPDAVGNLAAKREEVFGQANLADKEVVIGRDMPAKLSSVLPQETMQAMTTGEGMEVPRKKKIALNLHEWTAPVILASNHMPDYVNTGNNVGRRIVCFNFGNPITNPDPSIEEEVYSKELPALVMRSITAYHALRARIQDGGGGFWRAMPQSILRWQGMLAAATNKLYAFLTMDDQARGCTITRCDIDPSTGTQCITWMETFQQHYEACMQGKLVKDAAVFAALGYRLSDKYDHVCKSCRQLAKGGNESNRCCAAYSSSNRTKKEVIYNMRITAVADDIDDDDGGF